jgi:uncharacterized protein YfaS (alpha-2-macroglobulin family)
MSRRTLLTNLAVYLAVVLLAVGFAYARARNERRFAAQAAPDTLPASEIIKTPPDEHAKPFFSLHTNRTYATTDRARVFVNYRGLDSLDFRVYRVKDPVAFFRDLDNPHQVGEDEQAEIGKMTERKPTFLERLRQFKSTVYGTIKGYVRAQLQNQSRKSFNRKFRAEEDDTSNRTPLNVADYARVPLLNPSQMVSSWREKLPPLEDVYDRRLISLGRREPGVYLIEAVNGDLRAYGITIVTDLATVHKTSPDGSMLVYAVERRTGAPREGVEVRVVHGRREAAKGTTDRHGLARLRVEKPRPANADDDEETEAEGEETEASDEEAETSDEPYLIMATEGENFSISDLGAYYFSGMDEGGGGQSLTGYLYTDRPAYRPEQKVYFKGILRRLTESGYQLAGGSGATVNVTVEDPAGGRIYEQALPLSPRGTFAGELDLPEEAPLGVYTVNAALGEASASGYFSVEEYRKPEYKVRVTTPQSFFRAGERARFTVSANYYFGAPVTRADVKYYVYRSRYYGWWREGGEDESDEFGADVTAEEGGENYYGYNDQMMLEGEGRLNEQGRLEIEFTVPEGDPKEGWDYTYNVQAQVTDAARRTMEGAASFVGVRSNTTASATAERFVYYQGDTARIRVRANDREGRPVATRIGLAFFEQRWEKVIKRDESGYEYPDYELHERQLATATVETNQAGEAVYDYPVTTNGSIRIKTIVEEQGRPAVTEAGELWVSDREGRWSDVSYVGDGAIKLVPDKKSYRPGETARVLALLPTDRAHLLVTTELTGIIDVRTLDVAGRAAIIEVPIESRFAPNVFLNVIYVKGSEFLTEELTLVVPARDRLLDVEIIPNKKVYRPRETASYTVLARNADGSPAAGAEVSLGVVDESIYQIAPEAGQDIRRAFYGRRYNRVSTDFSIHYYFSGYAGKEAVRLAGRRRPGRLADLKSEAAGALVRKIFKDTAFWQPALVTGADGKANVKFELPDNLTTWRATARAVTADTRVGVAVTRVVERKDVIIRVAAPRFLTAGDTVTLSGVVHNYLKSEKVTRISIEVTGAQLLNAATQTVTIPAGGEHRLDWRVAAPTTGELKILARALTDTESDALEMSLPVRPRGLRQTRAESTAISEDEAERTFTFNLPAGADPNARSLKIEVAPSVAGSLFGALDYLTTYPYGCTEQTMSSFLPNVIVRQALQTVETARIGEGNDLDRKVRKGLKRLYGFQHEDGGWGWWKDDPTDAWMTAYVVDGLAQAERAGYEIEAARLERGRGKLAALLDEGRDGQGQLNDEKRAYMAYALAASGGIEARHLEDLFRRRGDLSHYGRALVALAFSAIGDERRAATMAGQIERAAQGGGAEAHWGSAEATALSVRALARLAPQSELLPKAARWLVKSRRFGSYWLSTRETAWAVYALVEYLRVSRELDADYTFEVYLNGAQVLSQRVTGADASSSSVFRVERRDGEVAATNEVRVVKRGRGVLYLAATLTHYTGEEQTAAQAVPQLRLAREYFRLRVVEKQDGGLGWQTEPLTGEVRSGDLIVSRLRVEGEGADYLMVEDPIPAGCEQVEEVSGLSLDHTEQGWSDWYGAREFRDDRTVFFLNRFGGRATFQYAMRVQIPGQFRVAPARAELMYQPDVRTNATGASLVVLDR